MKLIALSLLWSCALAPLYMLRSNAQDAGTAVPDHTIQRNTGSDGMTSKAQARMDYFHTRITYPGGSVPVGARAKAWKYSQEHMSMYQPAGGSRTASAFEWKNKGPANIGGRIVAVAANPKNPNTIFIGAADGGIWRTYDEGKSWHSVSDDFPTQAMGSIAIDPADTSVVYAGTGEASFAQRTFDGGGLYKSTDGGSTWSEAGVGSLPEYARVADMVIDPSRPGTVYIAIPDGVRNDSLEGIWKTSDAGATWTQVFQGRPTDIVLDPRRPDVLYTASSKISAGASTFRSGLQKSTDGGATWTRMDIGIDPETMGRTSIAISASDPDILYLGVSSLSGSGDRTWLLGIFKTTDAGATWTKTPVPFDYMVSQGWYDNIIGIDPTDPDIVFAGGVKLIRSSDGGATWTRIRDQGFGGILHVDQHAIDFNVSDPDRVYIGNDGGFFLISQQGSNVEKRDLGLSITQFIGGALHPASDEFLFGGTQDNGTEISGAAPLWNLALYGDGGNGAVNPQKPNVLFTTQETLKLWRSEDFGKTWSQAMGDLPMESSLFYIDYAMDNNNPSRMYLGTYRMYKTIDEGRKWSQVHSCLFPTGTSCYYITAVSTADYDDKLVFAGSTGGYVAVSLDAGINWRVYLDALPTAYCSSVRSFEPGTVYATYSRYGVPKVWKSTTAGTTWYDISGNLPDIPVNDIIRLDGTLIIGTDLGAFISDNEGATWQRFGTGLPSVSVQKLRYNRNTGTLRAMTHGRGMYDLRWTIPTPAAPVFVSRPDTSLLEAGQPFLYAPVVQSAPPAQFRLVEAPSGATIDPVFGIVRWSGGDKFRRFTVEASNAAGSATQTFTLSTVDVVAADWEVISSSPMSSNVNGLRFTGGSTLWVTRDSGWISRSLDGGTTWDHRRLPGEHSSVFGLHAFDRDRAVVGTRGGRLMRTTDGGISWEETLSLINARFGNIHFWDDLNGIAVTSGERDSADVFLTHDGGASWSQAASHHYARSPIDNSLFFFDASNGWYASSNQGNSPPRNASVLRTRDGGENWATTDAGTRNVSSIGFLTPDKGYLVDNVQNRARRTANGGSSWTTTFWPTNGLRSVAVCADPSSNALWIVTDTSAWVSRNEGTLWTRTQMVPCGPIQAAVFADSAHGWAVARNGIVQRLRSNPFVTGVEAARHRGQSAFLGDGYPNPVASADASAVIPFTLHVPSSAVLKVFNAAGKEVTTLFDGELAPGDHAAVWHVGSVPNGMYFYALTAVGRTMTGRIALAR